MNIVRTDQQSALQEILIATEESADHLREAAEFIDSSEPRRILEQLASTRSVHVNILRAALRELGDLPIAPDPDRETAEQAIQRLHAWLTPDDSDADYLQQRAESERKLLEHIERNRTDALEDKNLRSLDALTAHVEETVRRLEELASEERI